MVFDLCITLELCIRIVDEIRFVWEEDATAQVLGYCIRLD